jgi:hypothetical protein
VLEDVAYDGKSIRNNRSSRSLNQMRCTTDVYRTSL